MWKKLLAYFAHLLTLAEITQENKAEIKEIRQELRDLTARVQELGMPINSDGTTKRFGKGCFAD